MRRGCRGVRSGAAAVVHEYDGPRRMHAGSLARWTLRCRAGAPLAGRRALRGRASLAERLGQRAGERSRRRGLSRGSREQRRRRALVERAAARVAPVRSHPVRRAPGCARHDRVHRARLRRAGGRVSGVSRADVHRGSVAVQPALASGTGNAVDRIRSPCDRGRRRRDVPAGRERTHARAGRPRHSHLHLRAEDRWGNPAHPRRN